MSEPRTYVLKGAPAVRSLTLMARREISEMLGVCRGVIADGVVTPGEVQFLDTWLTAHPLAASGFPGSAVAVRLRRIYADGTVTDEERADLLALLEDATGQVSTQAATAPTRLPLDEPAPPVAFEGFTFCFTGKFASGTRSWCEGETTARGGVCKSAVDGGLHYLVIGSVGNDQWAHSSFGRKIEKAVALKSCGGALAVISEQHWCEALRLTVGQEPGLTN